RHGARIRNSFRVHQTYAGRGKSFQADAPHPGVPYPMNFRRARHNPSNPRPRVAIVPGSGTPLAVIPSSTVTVNDPVLLKKPPGVSPMPRNKRVAPAGMTNVC